MLKCVCLCISPGMHALLHVTSEENLQVSTILLVGPGLKLRLLGFAFAPRQLTSLCKPFDCLFVCLYSKTIHWPEALLLSKLSNPIVYLQQG